MKMPPSIRAAPVRARDLRDNIRSMGFERGTIYTLELLLDEFAAHRENMRDMTELLAQCIDNVAKMVHVGEHAKAQIEELKRRRDQGDAIDHGEY